MKFKHMFKRTAVKNDAVNEKKTRFSARKPEVPDGLMKKCNACKTAVFVEEVKQNNYICPHCQNYFGQRRCSAEKQAMVEFWTRRICN